MFKTHRVIKNCVFKRKNKPKFINNQRTLLGYLLSLMEGQKIAVALIHLRQDDESDIIIPIGFKIDEKKIPEDIQPMKFHPSNLIELSVDGCDSINVMLVSIGDDSQELISIYSGFCVKMEKFKSKIGRFEKKINYWLNIESLKIEKSKKPVLQIVKEKDFEFFLNRVAILNRREKAKTSQETNSTMVDSKTVVDIDSTGSDESNNDSDYEMEIVNRGVNRRATSSDSTPNRKASKKNSDREIIQQSLEKIKTIIHHPKSDPSGRTFMAETFNIFDFLIRHNDMFDSVELYQSFSNDSEDLRFLTEEDPTKQVGKNILIEGILPLPSEKYKTAIKCKNCKQDELDFGPAAIITNLIKYTFPDHWVDNVTLRGCGGRISLINIWNHCDPHQFPLQDPVEKGLGESRFRALLDHAVRMSGRKTYDKATEKILVSSISKAMHYARSKLAPVKKSSKIENFFELKENISFEPKPDRKGKLIKGTLRIHPPDSTFFEDMAKKDVLSDDEETVSDIMKPQRKSSSHRILDDPENEESGKFSNSVDSIIQTSSKSGKNSDLSMETPSNAKIGIDRKKSPVVVLTSLDILKDQAIFSESSGYVEADSLQYDKSPASSPIHKSTPKRKLEEIEDFQEKEKAISCDFEVHQADDFVPLTQTVYNASVDTCDSGSKNLEDDEEDLSDEERELLLKLQKKKKLYARFMAKCQNQTETEEK